MGTARRDEPCNAAKESERGREKGSRVRGKRKGQIEGTRREEGV